MASAVSGMRAMSTDTRKRAILANAFVWGRAAYSLHHLPWPRCSLRKAMSHLAAAVWSRYRVSVPQARLTLPPDRGGLGLVSPTVARMVSRWAYFSTASVDPLLAGSFLRTLAPYLPNVIVYAGLPPRRRLSPFLAEIVSDVLTIRDKVGLAEAASMNPRQLRAELLRKLVEPPPVRLRYLPFVSHPILCRAAAALCPAPARSLYYRLHLNALPTGSWLLPRGLCTIPQSYCRFCPGSCETPVHLFLLCPAFSCLRSALRLQWGVPLGMQETDLFFPAFRSRRSLGLFFTYLWVVWRSRNLPEPPVRVVLRAPALFEGIVRTLFPPLTA